MIDATCWSQSRVRDFMVLSLPFLRPLGKRFREGVFHGGGRMVAFYDIEPREIVVLSLCKADAVMIHGGIKG